MRTQEEFLTQVVLKEIPCPCGAECEKATKDASVGKQADNNLGMERNDSVITFHEEKEEYYHCIALSTVKLFQAWITYKTPGVLSRKHGHVIYELAGILKEPYKEFLRSAFLRAIKRESFHLCSDINELKTKTLQRFEQMCRDVIADLYPLGDSCEEKKTS